MIIRAPDFPTEKYRVVNKHTNVNFTGVFHKRVLSEAMKLQHEVTSLTAEVNGQTVTLKVRYNGCFPEKSGATITGVSQKTMMSNH